MHIYMHETEQTHTHKLTYSHAYLYALSNNISLRTDNHNSLVNFKMQNNCFHV